MKKNVLLALLAGMMVQLTVSCKTRIPADLTKANLIPKPVTVTATGSSFELNESTVVYVQEGSEELKQIGQLLADEIKAITDLTLKVQTTAQAPKRNGLFLTITPENTQIGTEGYDLMVTEDVVTLKANQSAGVFRGLQTIKQVLTFTNGADPKQQPVWLMATGNIVDYPEYAYRGAMLDVARHFFEVKDVKRLIDLLADYKINILHLHLSDDQGWRIEIKSWPKLTAIGGSTEVGGGEGGFYTQEQYKEIVQYAKERYITIIPEIDMPGHTNAALASYPELNCNNKAPKLYTGMKVGFSSLCTSKEITYKFVDDVIGEVAALTDGPYIHIGGDESHATKEKDYIKFMNRVQDIVKAHGKTMIGWDEVAHADIKPEAIIQYWAKSKNALLGVEKGAKVIMSPSKQAYLDMQYDSTTHLGLHWAGYVELDQAYNWDPANLVEGINKENVLGVESPLWSETVTNMDEIEYMVFPRIIGHAEIGWTAVENRSWEDYKVRLAKHGKRLKELGVNYYASPLIPWENEDATK
ncbi:beta-N-acetylhexosaminidase [Marinilabiliaceae bacterium JC017]|nr:beta-N-acetylhexosaminidase [Marinilabiliaceae bacterium JC017]